MTNLQFRKRLHKLCRINKTTNRIFQAKTSFKPIHVIDNWYYQDYTTCWRLGMLDSSNWYIYMTEQQVYDRFLSDSNKGLKNKAKFIQELKDMKLFIQMQNL